MNIIIIEPGNITMAKLNGDWNILNSAGGVEYSGDLASITSIELSSNSDQSQKLGPEHNRKGTITPKAGYF